MNSGNQPNISYDKRSKRFVGNIMEAFLSMHHNSSHEVIDTIEDFVKDNARDISTSQLRGVFSQVKKASSQEIPLLRAKIAYVQGRTDRNKEGMHKLLDLLNDLMREIAPNEEAVNLSKLDSFKDFFEAVLSFHKLHGAN